MLLFFPILLAVGAVQEEAAPHLLFARHERCLQSERALDFFAVWTVADDEARARAEGRLIARFPRGAPAAANPGSEDLMDATRELRGGGEAGPFDEGGAVRQRELQLLADQVDLAVVPGAFAARDAADGDKGEPTTVHVRALSYPRTWTDSSVELVWVGPAGRRSLARSEPVTITALATGFPMYLRPPASGPGVWQLVPRIVREGHVASGGPAAVECVERLAERWASVAPAPEGGESDERAFQRRLLSDLIEHGARTTVALRASQALAMLEGDGDPVWPRPTERAYTERGGLEGWIWALVPKGEVQRTIVLIGPGDLLPELAFAGVVGEGWRAVADGHGALVLALALPPWNADVEPAHVMARLPEIARGLGAPEDVEVVFVVRGGAVPRLSFLAKEPPGDAFVFSTVLPESRAAVIYPESPRLVISPGGAEEVPEDVGASCWVTGSSIPLLNELRLPSIVGAWLTARARSAAGEER